jgi:hypothetical protein
LNDYNQSHRKGQEMSDGRYKYQLVRAKELLIEANNSLQSGGGRMHQKSIARKIQEFLKVVIKEESQSLHDKHIEEGKYVQFRRSQSHD